MLPEHVKALREWRDDERDPKAHAPIFDEQLNETFDRLLQQAVESHLPLVVTFIEAGREQMAKGIITKLDPLKEMMILRDSSDKLRHIPIHQIIQMNQT